MYRWLVERLTRWVLGRLRQGETRWLLAAMADDVHFRFLGDHSWSADFRSKQQVRRWLTRYVRAGLQLDPREIVVTGPPWNTLVCTRFTDEAKDGRGEVIYRNEGMLFDRIAWGRIREHVSYEDTQRTAEFDRQVGEASRADR